MAGYEQKDMSGSMFPNENRTRDSQPEWRGSALIDGVEYWVSGWEKEGRKGPWRSLSFQKKEVRRDEPRQSISQQALDRIPPRRDPRITSGPQHDDMKDEIPF